VTDPTPVDGLGGRVASRRGHVEREVKLDADPELALPDLHGATAGLVPIELAPRRLDATYFDADDLRLLDRGITVRRRTGEGTRWTVKRSEPSGAGADPDRLSATLDRREIDIVDPSWRPPDGVLELIGAELDRATLLPVARLVSERRRVELRDASHAALAEVDDDVVAVHRDGDGAEVARFREIEIELADGIDDRRAAELLDAVVARLVSAGARRKPPQSKVDRALGLLGRR
jgi:inorganic triphosphatase YgiF